MSIKISRWMVVGLVLGLVGCSRSCSEKKPVADVATEEPAPLEPVEITEDTIVSNLFKEGKVTLEEFKLINEYYMAEVEKEGNHQKTETGVLYRVIKPGDVNSKLPKIGDKIKIRFRVENIDDIVIENSNESTPVDLDYQLTIPGWKDVLSKVGHEGSQIEIITPSQRAYGSKSDSRIPPYSSLKFVIGVEKITSN